jgi:hypothetical protein
MSVSLKSDASVRYYRAQGKHKSLHKSLGVMRQSIKPNDSGFVEPLPTSRRTLSSRMEPAPVELELSKRWVLEEADCVLKRPTGPVFKTKNAYSVNNGL